MDGCCRIEVNDTVEWLDSGPPLIRMVQIHENGNELLKDDDDDDNANVLLGSLSSSSLHGAIFRSWVLF